LAEELDPRFRGDERTTFDFARSTAFFFVLFFIVFFFVFLAMQIALSASGFGV
jgi:hypothetical protein